ncbi:MAG TPA: replication protein [Bdellovibrionota bacterium]|nr:replication protein [Bdellovibrionota bacterium]
MSERNELKQALADFPIKKPFPLKRTPVQLKPPTPVPAPTQVTLEAPVPVPPSVPTNTGVTVPAPVDAKTEAPIETEVSRSTVVPEESPVATKTSAPEITAQVSVATPVPAQTQVSCKTEVAPPPPVSENTRVPTATPATVSDGHSTAARDQDSAVTLEAQTASKLDNGYTRLPNAILMRIVNGDLLRSEIQVLLLIARFTISFQKRHAPLSKAVLERRTGLRGPAVLQAISALLAKGLIEKIPGDQYRPNLLGLRFTDEWDFFGKKSGFSAEPPVSAETRVTEATTVAPSTPVNSETNGSVAPATPAGIPAETHFKDIPTKENNNSLSAMPDSIQSYFSETMPARKRESEWRAYKDLRQQYSDPEIAKCLQSVRNDQLPGGETCHSPMAYLAVAMNEILAKVCDRERLALRRAEEAARFEAEARRQSEEDAREQLEQATRERAFSKFLENQNEAEVIAQTCIKHNFPITTGPIARSFAISRWWSVHAKSEGYAECSN